MLLLVAVQIRFRFISMLARHKNLIIICLITLMTWFDVIVNSVGMLRGLKAGGRKGRKRSMSAASPAPARSRSPLSGSPEFPLSSDDNDEESGYTRSPPRVGRAAAVGKKTARGKAAHTSVAKLSNCEAGGVARSPLDVARLPVPLKKTGGSAAATAAASKPQTQTTTAASGLHLRSVFQGPPRHAPYFPYME